MNRMPAGPARSGQFGLTLIELMLSIVIGLVVVGTVTYLYVGSRGAYRGNESLARIQEAGRFGLDAIARDVRRAGGLGCGSSASVATGGAIAINVIARPPAGATPAALTVNANTPVQGYSPAAYIPLPTTAPTAWPALPAGVPAYRGGDVLQLQVAYGAPVRVIGNADTTGATIPIADNSASNFRTGDYAVLANCSAATIFQVSSVAAGPTAPQALLGYAVGTAAAGGNGSVGGGVPSLSLPQQPGFAFDSYSTVQHFDQVTYYVGTVPNSVSAAFPSGLPALYRYSARNGTVEELVENIEDMDIVFGINNSPMVLEHAGLMGPTDWQNVVSVRVSLMAVGDQLGAAAAALAIPFRTDPTQANQSALLAWNAPDTRLRQVFTATAAMRDRLN